MQDGNEMQVLWEIDNGKLPSHPKRQDRKRNGRDKRGAAKERVVQRSENSMSEFLQVVRGCCNRPVGLAVFRSGGNSMFRALFMSAAFPPALLTSSINPASACEGHNPSAEGSGKTDGG